MKVFDNTVSIDKIHIINNVDVDEWKEVVATMLKHNHTTWNIAEKKPNKVRSIRVTVLTVAFHR